MIKAKSESAKIEALISRMLEDDSPDHPVVREGFVRTLLYPCNWYQLSEERMVALRDYAFASGSNDYYLKLLLGEQFYYQTSDVALTEAVMHSGDVELAEAMMRLEEFTLAEAVERLGKDKAAYRTVLGQKWERVEDLWWRGDWVADLDVVDYTDFLEHALIDQAGAWMILFSQEDHGYLVSDQAISRELLDVWHTTPKVEIDRYASDLERGAFADVDGSRRILEYALAGLWM